MPNALAGARQEWQTLLDRFHAIPSPTYYYYYYYYLLLLLTTPYLTYLWLLGSFDNFDFFFFLIFSFSSLCPSASRQKKCQKKRDTLGVNGRRRQLVSHARAILVWAVNATTTRSSGAPPFPPPCLARHAGACRAQQPRTPQRPSAVFKPP